MPREPSTRGRPASSDTPVSPPAVDLGALFSDDSGYESDTTLDYAPSAAIRSPPPKKKLARPRKSTKKRRKAHPNPSKATRVPNAFLHYKNEAPKLYPGVCKIVTNTRQRIRLFGRMWALEKPALRKRYQERYYAAMRAQNMKLAEQDLEKRQLRADRVTANRLAANRAAGRDLDARSNVVLELWCAGMRRNNLIRSFNAWAATVLDESLVKPLTPLPGESLELPETEIIVESESGSEEQRTPPLSPSSPSRVTTPGLYSSVPTTPSAFSSMPTTPSAFRRLADISPDYDGYHRKASVKSEDREPNALRVSFEPESEDESEDGDFVVASTPHVYDDGPDDVPVDACDQAEFEDAQAMLDDEPTLAAIMETSGALSDDALDPALLDFGTPLPYDELEPSTNYAISNDGYERLVEWNTYCHPAESPRPDWFGLGY
ncbi:hypothetical protein EXIGLDRAFT_728676 [Exidia glandulosa HHB12029]|uniref:Uncharacterized protein n=1 Tax=Exidia glandulosa HHB12029 TaxID=1314781 RepID=A0A165LRC6_EXIGL|nr:hypothetical protein EXIGLDRAFT_728676 [Exidia glandulosa HHB12029]